MEDNTITFNEVHHPIMTLFDSSNNEILSFQQNGDIFIKGKLAEADSQVVEGFRDFLRSQGYATENYLLTDVVRAAKENPNDMMLGKIVRELIEKRTK